jgi:hypothetical protein
MCLLTVDGEYKSLGMHSDLAPEEEDFVLWFYNESWNRNEVI